MSDVREKLEAQREDLVERNTITTDVKQTKSTSKDYAIKDVFSFPKQPTKRFLSCCVGATDDMNK